MGRSITTDVSLTRLLTHDGDTASLDDRGTDD